MSTSPCRRDLALAAADALAQAQPSLSEMPAFVGFDGCVDSIIHIVDKRHGPGDYQRMTRMTQFAERIAQAAGKSANIELVVQRRKVGGNAAIMAWALQRLGAPITLVGALGDATGAVEPILQELADGCREVIVTGPAAATDAAEFDDGKIMLGKNEVYETLTFDRLKEVLGLDQLRQLIGESSLIATVNWTMMPDMGGIWAGLMDEVLPQLGAGKPRRLFVDLTDPAKRTSDDLLGATKQLTALGQHLPLTLGLNLSEAAQVATVLDLDAGFAAREPSDPRELQAVAATLREKLELDCVLIHPREGAAGANAAGDSAWFAGPFVARPLISTGGGDHFNAGAALASLLDLPLPQTLAIGTAVSGYYVRNAASPSLDDLVGFLRELPESEP